MAIVREGMTAHKHRQSYVLLECERPFFRWLLRLCSVESAHTTAPEYRACERFTGAQ